MKPGLSIWLALMLIGLICHTQTHAQTSTTLGSTTPPLPETISSSISTSSIQHHQDITIKSTSSAEQQKSQSSVPILNEPLSVSVQISSKPADASSTSHTSSSVIRKTSSISFHSQHEINGEQSSSVTTISHASFRSDLKIASVASSYVEHSMTSLIDNILESSFASHSGLSTLSTSLTINDSQTSSKVFQSFTTSSSGLMSVTTTTKHELDIGSSAKTNDMSYGFTSSLHSITLNDSISTGHISSTSTIETRDVSASLQSYNDSNSFLFDTHLKSLPSAHISESNTAISTDSFSYTKTIIQSSIEPQPTFSSISVIFTTTEQKQSGSLLSAVETVSERPSSIMHGLSSNQSVEEVTAMTQAPSSAVVFSSILSMLPSLVLTDSKMENVSSTTHYPIQNTETVSSISESNPTDESIYFETISSRPFISSSIINSIDVLHTSLPMRLSFTPTFTVSELLSSKSILDSLDIVLPESDHSLSSMYFSIQSTTSFPLVDTYLTPSDNTASVSSLISFRDDISQETGSLSKTRVYPTSIYSGIGISIMSSNTTTTGDSLTYLNTYSLTHTPTPTLEVLQTESGLSTQASFSYTGVGLTNKTVSLISTMQSTFNPSDILDSLQKSEVKSSTLASNTMHVSVLSTTSVTLSTHQQSLPTVSLGASRSSEESLTVVGLQSSQQPVLTSEFQTSSSDATLMTGLTSSLISSYAQTTHVQPFSSFIVGKSSVVPIYSHSMQTNSASYSMDSYKQYVTISTSKTLSSLDSPRYSSSIFNISEHLYTSESYVPKSMEKNVISTSSTNSLSFVFDAVSSYNTNQQTDTVKSLTSSLDRTFLFTSVVGKTSSLYSSYSGGFDSIFTGESTSSSSTLPGSYGSYHQLTPTSLSPTAGKTKSVSTDISSLIGSLSPSFASGMAFTSQMETTTLSITSYNSRISTHVISSQGMETYSQSTGYATDRAIVISSTTEGMTHTAQSVRQSSISTEIIQMLSSSSIPILTLKTPTSELLLDTSVFSFVTHSSFPLSSSHSELRTSSMKYDLSTSLYESSKDTSYSMYFSAMNSITLSTSQDAMLTSIYPSIYSPSMSIAPSKTLSTSMPLHSIFKQSTFKSMFHSTILSVSQLSKDSETKMFSSHSNTFISSSAVTLVSTFSKTVDVLDSSNDYTPFSPSVSKLSPSKLLTSTILTSRNENELASDTVSINFIIQSISQTSASPTSLPIELLYSSEGSAYYPSVISMQSDTYMIISSKSSLPNLVTSTGVSPVFATELISNSVSSDKTTQIPVGSSLESTLNSEKSSNLQIIESSIFSIGFSPSMPSFNTKTFMSTYSSSLTNKITIFPSKDGSGIYSDSSLISIFTPHLSFISSSTLLVSVISNTSEILGTSSVSIQILSSELKATVDFSSLPVADTITQQFSSSVNDSLFKSDLSSSNITPSLSSTVQSTLELKIPTLTQTVNYESLFSVTSESMTYSSSGSLLIDSMPSYLISSTKPLDHSYLSSSGYSLSESTIHSFSMTPLLVTQYNSNTDINTYQSASLLSSTFSPELNLALSTTQEASMVSSYFHISASFDSVLVSSSSDKRLTDYHTLTPLLHSSKQTSDIILSAMSNSSHFKLNTYLSPSMPYASNLVSHATSSLSKSSISMTAHPISITYSGNSTILLSSFNPSIIQYLSTSRFDTIFTEFTRVKHLTSTFDTKSVDSSVKDISIISSSLINVSVESTDLYTDFNISQTVRTPIQNSVLVSSVTPTSVSSVRSFLSTFSSRDVHMTIDPVSTFSTSRSVFAPSVLPTISAESSMSKLQKSSLYISRDVSSTMLNIPTPSSQTYLAPTPTFSIYPSLSYTPKTTSVTSLPSLTTTTDTAMPSFSTPSTFSTPALPIILPTMSITSDVISTSPSSSFHHSSFGLISNKLLTTPVSILQSSQHLSPPYITSLSTSIGSSIHVDTPSSSIESISTAESLAITPKTELLYSTSTMQTGSTVAIPSSSANYTDSLAISDNVTVTLPSTISTNLVTISVSTNVSLSTSISSSSMSSVTPQSTPSPTTEAPLEMTTLNASNAEEPYWVRTVMKIRQSVDVSSETFKDDLERNLALVYERAFQRERLIERGEFEPFRRRRRLKKRYTSVGDAAVHIHEIVRDPDSSSVSAIYTVEKSGQVLSATDAVAAMEVLDTQEVAILLQQVVSVKAETYLHAEPTIDSSKDSSQLWLVAAIGGPVLVFVIFIWIILCIYFKCCSRKRAADEVEPRLTSLQQQSPKKVSDLSTIQEPSPHTSKTLPHQGSRASLLRPKVRAYEINSPIEAEIIAEEHKAQSSPVKKKIRPPPTTSKPNGALIRVEPPETPPKSATASPRHRKGKKLRRNSVEPLVVESTDIPAGNGDRNHLLQSSLSDDNEELQERARRERRKNKDRQRERRKKERDEQSRVAEYVTSQNHLNTLGLPHSPVPSVYVESKKIKSSAKKSFKLNRHDRVT